MFRCLLVSLVMLMSSTVLFAEEQSTQTEDSQERSALIKLDVVVDTDGIKDAILVTNQSMMEVVRTLDKISKNKELTPEQAEIIVNTTQNINHLAVSSTRVVEVLPEAIANAKQSLILNSQLFFSDLKMSVLMVLIVVVIGLAVVIGCLYWFVIKPMQSTIIGATNNVASMANSIQITAKSLEESNKIHTKLIQILEQEQT